MIIIRTERVFSPLTEEKEVSQTNIIDKRHSYLLVKNMMISYLHSGNAREEKKYFLKFYWRQRGDCRSRKIMCLAVLTACTCVFLCPFSLSELACSNDIISRAHIHIKKRKKSILHVNQIEIYGDVNSAGKKLIIFISKWDFTSFIV